MFMFKLNLDNGNATTLNLFCAVAFDLFCFINTSNVFEGASF